jgi:hypothetical protein
LNSRALTKSNVKKYLISTVNLDSYKSIKVSANIELLKILTAN